MPQAKYFKKILTNLYKHYLKLLEFLYLSRKFKFGEVKMRNKKAFTMLELVFILVILGILAAVAIPKISASRDDAKLVALKAILTR